MSQEKDGLFGMIDDIGGEARLIVFEERDAIFARDIFCGYDDELVPWNCRIEMDGADFSACDGAAHGHTVERIGKGDVVSVEGFTRDFLAAFFPGDRFADDWMSHRGGLNRPFCLVYLPRHGRRATRLHAAAESSEFGVPISAA